MSAGVIAATKRSLLTKLVTRKEPFQLTAESRRKSLPSTLNRKLLPPAVALLGEMPLIEGRRTPQDRQPSANVIVSRQTGDGFGIANFASSGQAWQQSDDML